MFPSNREYLFCQDLFSQVFKTEVHAFRGFSQSPRNHDELRTSGAVRKNVI